MKLLPDKSQSKSMAVVLLILAVVLVYLIGFHWFALKHQELGGRISDLKADIERFSKEIGQKDEIMKRLAEMRSSNASNNLFLPGDNFDAAAANLTDRLKQIIATKADYDFACNVVSNRNVLPRETERFEKVQVEVRLRCNLPDFLKIVHEFESNAPMVFIDGVNIYQRYNEPPAQSRRTNRQLQFAELDIRFEMFGYLGKRI